MAESGFSFPKLEVPTMNGAGTEAMMAAQRRSVAAVSSASQILADGARLFSQRQAEIMQARMTDFTQNTQTMFKTDPTKPDVTANIDVVKTAYEQAITDARELMEIVAKAQSDALQVMNECVLANLTDMSKLTSNK